MNGPPEAGSFLPAAGKCLPPSEAHQQQNIERRNRWVGQARFICASSARVAWSCRWLESVPTMVVYSRAELPNKRRQHAHSARSITDPGAEWNFYGFGGMTLARDSQRGSLQRGAVITKDQR